MAAKKKKPIDTGTATVHLLDVGPQQYGDSLLCIFNDETVLIDGAHPGNFVELEGHPAIQTQVAAILGQKPDKLSVSLLMISHAHDDHIGCLPKLVRDGALTAEWAVVPDPDLGWGRSPTDERRDDRLDSRGRQLVAALREEPRSPDLSDAALSEFLSDAADIETPYRDMLKTLEANGTKLVRFGRDPNDALLKRFSKIGLELLGPGKAHLAVCAENVQQGRNDAVAFVADMLHGDAGSSPVDAYRRMMTTQADTTDVKRFGNFVNLQSIVACFDVGGKKFFFAGDMQFMDPQTSEPVIHTEIDRLLGEIAHRAPYAFFKLCHHGSWNGLRPPLLDSLTTTRHLGICAGSGSTAHPSGKVLDLLDSHKTALTWARTDHNGHCTFHYGQTTTVDVQKGTLNDPVPNKKVDELAVIAPIAAPLPAEEPRPAPPVVVERTSDDRTVEIVARIPHTRTRVTISVEVDPGNSASGDGGAPGAIGPHGQTTRSFAPSSAVRGLLFATSSQKLGGNIGAGVAGDVIGRLRDAGATVVDVPAAAIDAASASGYVRQELQRNRNVKGVVLLGGYDVIPSQSLDALPPSVRRSVGSTADPDNFIIWNDETYGDVDGDLLPELPVSRIPDGHSADLVINALSQNGTGGGDAAIGVRNIQRPFAEGIFGRLNRRGGGMLTSAPTAFSTPTLKLDGDRVYLMLHGDYTDGSRFWGENPPDDDIEAVNLTNVPRATRAVVFTGCCWGALTVERPAGRPGTLLTPKRPDTSIALSFLRNGARAFIGCTGAHYSPDQPPFDYFGGPMHEAFWRRIAEGSEPASALFGAKRDYIKGMPHGQKKPSSIAIEFKIWRQYTCLGLGW
jgi:beta-lactamase superfamily II metal-dependent hydrolase